MLEHRDRVALERVDRDRRGSEEGGNLLALHGDAVRAGDGARRLREQREVEWAAACTTREQGRGR
eukprot:5918132-Prymnesium_polylepis.1